MRLHKLLFILLFMPGMRLHGQDSVQKYWVFFKDKCADLSQASAGFTPRALERRARQQIALTYSDLPVCQGYTSSLSAVATRMGYPSKWLNAQAAWLNDAQLSQVRAWPFVADVQPIHLKIKDLDAEPEVGTRYGYGGGYTDAQLSQIGLNELHKMGYNGRGVLIAVMDNGFRQANQNPYLRHLFEDDRIVATYDFANQEEDVFDGGSHGQWVLTILAGWNEDASGAEDFYGSAHGASFILCHTEYDATETTQEEDNWVRAMEFADSLGADIFSTSLSYRNFDGGFDYGYQGMDGNTAIITRAADLAASKGVLVVNSAGNFGTDHIYAPADGDSVLAIGAVDSLGVIAGFSSHGPTFDQRIKPDICAMGFATSYIQSSGVFSRGNGTSFSCPVVSGMAACLLQAAPESASMEVFQALVASGDRFDHPDTVYGHGIPNGLEALQRLGKPIYSTVSGTENIVWDLPMTVYPNPAFNHFQIAVDNDTIAFEGILEIVDGMGRKVYSKTMQVAPFYNLWAFDMDADGWEWVPGQYIAVLKRKGEKTRLAMQKFMIFDN